MSRLNKKASLELSIRAIVIVVLAMTLLGLGLGFVRNVFEDIGGLSGDVSEQVKERILDDLITNDKKLAFPTTEVELSKTGAEILTIGVRNKNDDTLNYVMEFVGISDPDGNTFIADDWFQYGPGPFELPPAEAHVRNARLKLPSGVSSSGSYFLNFNIKDTAGNIYATKDFFIIVQG